MDMLSLIPSNFFISLTAPRGGSIPSASLIWVEGELPFDNRAGRCYDLMLRVTIEAGVQASQSYLRDPKTLRALQYFEAVARHGSIRLAAEEFGVTASAVSHQMRYLAAFLGEELLQKEGRGVVLTATGLRVQQDVSTIFKTIDAAIGGVIGGKNQQLRIAVCSSFGPYWLSERLPDFQRRYPDIDLELRLYAEDPMQTEAVADLIVTAMPVGLGFDRVTLFDEMLVAVCRPKDATAPPVERQRLITTDPQSEGFAGDWLDFLALTGKSEGDFDCEGWLRCTHYLLALGLAKSGMGVALVPDFVAAPDLQSGALVLADDRLMPSGRTYQLCYKASRSTQAALRTVVRWMTSQKSAGVTAAQARAGQ